MPAPATRPARHLIDCVLHQSEIRPDALAYRFLPDKADMFNIKTYKSISNIDLLKSIINISSELSKRLPLAASTQAERQPVILLICPPGLDFIFGLFAAMAVGAQVAPLQAPARHKDTQRWQQIISDAHPDAVLTISKLDDDIKALLTTSKKIDTPVLCIDRVEPNDFTQEDFHHFTQRLQPQDLALLQYTSGSTRSPKGVDITHANLMDNLQRISECFGHDQSSQGVIWLPPYHDMGLIGGILQPLYVGFPVTLMPPAAFLRRPARWLQAISHFEATTSGGPNFAYEYCLRRCTDHDLNELDLSSWKVAFNGAEPIRSNTLKEFSQRFKDVGFSAHAFTPCYGLAEATLIVTSVRNNNADQSVLLINRQALNQSQIQIEDSADASTQKITSCGTVVEGTDIKIVNPDTCTLANKNEIGEVWIKGPGVGQGYRNQTTADHTFNQTILDYECANENKWMRSGDLGFLYEGELYVTGRLKDLIIIRGKNYAPNDIELTVEMADELFLPSASAAFTLENQSLIILTECSRGQYDDQHLHKMTHQAIAAVSTQHGLQTHELVIVKPGSLPKTSSGKVQRQRCRELFQKNLLKTVYRSSSESSINETIKSDNDTTANLTELNADVQRWMITWLAAKLNKQENQIDPEHAFADIGVDSVTAVELANALEQHYSLEISDGDHAISPEAAWSYPTIQALSKLVVELIQQSNNDLAANSNNDNIDWEQALLTELKLGSDERERVKYE
ncbi:MAG: AMP-binding protein [Pseudomonadota bacterium]